MGIAADEAAPSFFGALLLCNDCPALLWDTIGCFSVPERSLFRDSMDSEPSLPSRVCFVRAKGRGGVAISGVCACSSWQLYPPRPALPLPSRARTDENDVQRR